MDELLKILEESPLETPQNIAKMLGMSEEEVKERIAEYERNGIIRGYRAIINEDKVGLEKVRAAIEVKITPERNGGFDRRAREISKFGEVTSVFLMSGAYDLLVFVEGKTLKDVALFVSEKLATMPGVISTSTHFILKIYKDQKTIMEGESEITHLPVSA